MKDVLIQQGLIDALLCKEKPTTMKVQDWRQAQMQMVSTICLYLTDEMVIHVFGETSPIVFLVEARGVVNGKISH